MILVGIREAEEKFDELVRLAIAGEEVVVTRRGERVARIIPFSAADVELAPPASAEAFGDE